ncbi:MAG: hypothetical protein WB492_09160 [Christiangramia sp.]
MKKLLGLLCVAVMFVSCQTETLEEDFNSLEVFDLKMDKVSVCHYSEYDDSYKIININKNALDAHFKHGDVQLIDSDGDGYVTNENMCGFPVDCDDQDMNKTDCSILNSLVGCYSEVLSADDFGAAFYSYIPIINQQTGSVVGAFYTLRLDFCNSYDAIELNSGFGSFNCSYDINGQVLQTEITEEEYEIYVAELIAIAEEFNAASEILPECN